MGVRTRRIDQVIAEWRFIADAFLTLSSLFVQQAIYKMYHRAHRNLTPLQLIRLPAHTTAMSHPCSGYPGPATNHLPVATLLPANQFNSEEQRLRRPCLLAAACFGTAPPQSVRTGSVQVLNDRHPPGGSTTAGFVWYSPAIASFHARGGKDDNGQ